MIQTISNFVYERTNYRDDIPEWKRRVYNLIYRKIVSPTEDFYYSIKYGAKNLIRWIPIIWYDRDWDWLYLGKMMEFKLRAMAKLELEQGHHTGSKRDARNMLICAHILKELIEDNSFDHSESRAKFFGRLPDTSVKWIQEEDMDFQFLSHRTDSKISTNAAREKMKLLGKIIGRHLTHWWD